MSDPKSPGTTEYEPPAAEEVESPTGAVETATGPSGGQDTITN
jgi:hypothetical protein